MPNFNDEDRDSSTDDDWDASSAEEEEKKPVAGEFFFSIFMCTVMRIFGALLPEITLLLLHLKISF